MTSKLQFQESLAETSLAEMFSTIYRHKVPGTVEVSRDEVVKRIFISDGMVVQATSTDRSDRLGAYLYRVGKLDRSQLVETMRQRQESETKLHGQILIETGLLSPAELYTAIRGQMESMVWSVFGWQEGEVRFRIGSFDEPISVRVHLPLRQAIVRGIRLSPDTKALVARLGRKTTVLKPSYSTEDLIEVALDAEEYELLRMVDGRRTLYDLCNGGPFGVPENARLLYAYRVLRLVETAGEAKGGVKIRVAADKTLA